jgi:hypothetical protein
MRQSGYAYLQFKVELIKNIYRHLDEAFRALDIVSIAAESGRIEDEIRGLLHREIFDYLCNSYPSFRAVSTDHFKVNTIMYQLEFGRLVGRPNLEVWIRPTEGPNAGPLEKEINLDGWGYYTRVSVVVSSNLKSNFGRICEVIKLVYDTSYGWLEETMLQKLNERKNECAVALYNYLRVVFRTESKDFLANNIWFGVFSDEKGCYLLDRDSSTHILDILSERKYRSEKSPMYHLLHLIGSITPYEKAISRLAIQENKCVDFPLPRAAYMSDDLDLFKTEEQMVQGGKYSLYPLSVNKKIRLVAAFPTIYKKDILPILKRHRSEISRIYESQIRSVDKLIRLLQKQFGKANWSQIGEFVGGVMGGFGKTVLGF